MNEYLLSTIRELVSQAWCTEKNKNKEMDDDLAEAISQNIYNRLMTLPRLFGRRDKKDGWEFHEKPGDMDTYECRTLGLKKLERDWD